MKLNEKILLDKQVDIILLRIIATLAVIFLHTNNTLSNNIESFACTKIQYIFFSTCNYLMNWAVPIFLMITGILLLDTFRIITPKMCIKKYVKKILLILFIFGIPFSMLEIFMNTRMITVFMIKEAFINVLNGDSWGHLWYLYTLIGIYLIFPLLKEFVTNCNRKTLKYILIVLFIFNFCIPWVNQLFKCEIAFSVPITSFSVFYVLTGKYLVDEIPGWLKNKKCNVVGFIILISINIIINIVTYPNGGDFLGYDSPVIAIMAIIVFVTIRMELKAGNCNTNKWLLSVDKLWKIDRLCFMVYLIHPLFINFIYKFLGFTPLLFEKLYMVMSIVFFLIFVMLSFTASWIMSLIKPIRKCMM